MMMMMMSFDTEYKRAYDARVVCVESAVLTTDTLQNQRAYAQINCDQTVSDTAITKACEKRSALYSSGNGFETH